MSGLFFGGQDSKTVHYYHDRPPQYDACQPNQDILTCVIENEHTHRMLVQRLDDLKKQAENLEKKMLKSTRPNYHLSSEVCLELSGYFAEGSQISAKLANIMKERTVETTELYTAMSRLTVSEFNRTYASFKRDPTRQIQHELAQDTERAKGAPAKLPRRFWKRMFKILARP